RSEDVAEVRTGAVSVTREGLAWRTYALDDDPEAVLAHYDVVKAELLCAQTPVEFAPQASATLDAWAQALRQGDWDCLERFWAPITSSWTRVMRRCSPGSTSSSAVALRRRSSSASRAAGRTPSRRETGTPSLPSTSRTWSTSTVGRSRTPRETKAPACWRSFA